MTNPTRTPANRDRLRHLVAAALIAALTAGSAYVSIPLGALPPLTLQVFCVALAAFLLPPLWAGGSLGVYWLLGAVGVPVYAHGAAGLGAAFGPTGGYLAGFVIGAALASLVRVSLERARELPRVAVDTAAGVLLLVVIYALGAAWLGKSLHLSVTAAIAGGVAPFVVVDAVKVAVAVSIATAVRRAGVRL